MTTFEKCVTGIDFSTVSSPRQEMVGVMSKTIASATDDRIARELERLGLNLEDIEDLKRRLSFYRDRLSAVETYCLDGEPFMQLMPPVFTVDGSSISASLQFKVLR